MDKQYYQTLSELQEKGVDNDYFTGWAGGYLQNTPREEQRATPAYEAGYEDGSNNTTEKSSEFIS